MRSPALTVAAALISVTSTAALAQEDAAVMTLFANVHIFDGVNRTRMENANVLVEGNLIKTVSTKAGEPGDATVIDGGGCTSRPGLVEGHAHLMLSRFV